MELNHSLLLIFIKSSDHSATNPQMVYPQVKNTDDNPTGPTLRIYIGNPIWFLGLPGCCFTAILTPTHQNGGIPQWTLGSVILPPIGTAAPQIPLSSKLKQAHQRAWKEAVRRCDRERGNKNEWEKNKKKASFTQSLNVTEPNPNQYLWVVKCCYNTHEEHITRRWKAKSG